MKFKKDMKMINKLKELKKADKFIRFHEIREDLLKQKIKHYYYKQNLKEMMKNFQK